MKRIYGVSLLFGVLVFATTQSFAAALQLQLLDGYGPYQTGSGGEFTFGVIAGDTSPTIASSYAADTRGYGSSASSFQTFCVEGTEYINANSTYSATYNTVTVKGGVALTQGAAWLYSQFATDGNFNGIATYNYDHGGLNPAARRNSANDLQLALWLLMGGQESTTLANVYTRSSDGSHNYFMDAAINKFGSFAGADTTAATVGYDGVYVMNLYGADGTPAQDQLVYNNNGNIPNVVPDGGMTVTLLGMGMTGLAFVSRRMRR
jgi:hypothetical protein